MSLLEKYLELVKQYEFSPLYNKWAFITCIAGCLERRVFLNEEALGLLYPNLYTVFVGPPASKKTTSMRLPADLFVRTIEHGPIVSSNQLTPATLIDELRDAGKDRGDPKSSCLFAICTEFSVFVRDIGGGSIVDLLLDFYDTRRPGEMWRKNTKKWGKQEMPNPSLTLLAATTPQHIVQSRLVETGGLGFTSRLVFVVEPRIVLGTKRFRPLNQALLDEIKLHFYRISQLEGQFVMDEGAIEEMDVVFDSINAWLLKNPGTTIMANYMSRKAVHVRKVAMCLSASRNSRKIIMREDVQQSAELFAELEPTMPDAFSRQVLYRDETLAGKILDKFSMCAELTERQLFRAFDSDGQSLPYNNEVLELLQGLVIAGRLERSKKDGENAYKKV